jgi:hypothetical protein
MAHKHGKKKEEKSPAKQRMNTIDALQRVHEVLCVIMCNTCERKETCVSRIDCILYSDKPPVCPSCKKPMEKHENTFICQQCLLDDMKKKRMEELE